MTFSPVVDNTQMDIGPSFYFMIKNGKLVVIVLLTLTFHFMKVKVRPILKF